MTDPLDAVTDRISRIIGDRAVIPIEDAGKILHKKRSAAYEMAKRGEIPTLGAGRNLVVPVAKLLHILGFDDLSNGSAVSDDAAATVQDVLSDRPPGATPGA